MESCCVCGRSLPNQYSVAGRCEETGCDAPFCALHWRRGNHRCPRHGYTEGNGPPAGGSGGSGDVLPADPVPVLPDTDADPRDEAAPAPEGGAPKPLPKAKAKALMKQTLDLVSKLGVGAGSLLKRLKKDTSPEGMITTLQEKLDTVRPRREAVAARLEALYNEIVEKKAQCSKAPPARRRVLEVELQSKLAEYKAGERELKILLENEQNITMVTSRLSETIAYGMAGIDEDLIDTVAMDVDDAADDAEARADAIRDLDRAGKRREREDETEDLWDELAAFESLETEASPETESQPVEDIGEGPAEDREPERPAADAHPE